MRKKHLFYIRSNFHYIICEAIIREKKIDDCDILFVLYRGIEIDCKYKDQVLYYGEKSSFLNRLYNGVVGKEELKDLLGDYSIIAYLPFYGIFPDKMSFKNYVFYEEGFSAYSKLVLVDKKLYKENFVNFLKKILIHIVLFFRNNNIRSYVFGITFTDSNNFKDDNKSVPLYTLSNYSYLHLKNNCIQKRVIDLSTGSNELITNYSTNIERGGNILVLDRIANLGRRPYSIENYFRCLDKVIKSINSKIIYVKQHPSDFNNKESREVLLNFFSNYDVEFIEINNSLEELALENKQLNFFGFHSTILFYAPLLGRNFSYAYFESLANIDEKYSEFIMEWGGIDQFKRIFQKYVQCQ